jgi:hypothetical protein
VLDHIIQLVGDCASMKLTENSLATIQFPSKLSRVRSCMNTSASSKSIIVFHLVATENKADKPSSTQDSGRPSSLGLILSSGRRVWSAMLSVQIIQDLSNAIFSSFFKGSTLGEQYEPAVYVLPTPGGPWSRKMSPFPFP